MPKRGDGNIMDMFAEQFGDDDVGEGAKKKKARVVPPPAVQQKRAVLKPKAAPVEQASQPSDDGGGQDEGSEAEPMGSPDLFQEVNVMSTALSNTFHAALASKKKAFDAHCKAVAKLRKDTDNEVAQIIARATSLLDQLDEDREAKAKEKRTTIQAIAHRALNEMSESFKSIKGVHKECVNANETSRREFAEEMEKIKAELDLAMKQSLARVAAEKKKVREEPILPRAVIESISAACRQHA